MNGASCLEASLGTEQLQFYGGRTLQSTQPLPFVPSLVLNAPTSAVRGKYAEVRVEISSIVSVEPVKLEMVTVVAPVCRVVR